MIFRTDSFSCFRSSGFSLFLSMVPMSSSISNPLKGTLVGLILGLSVCPAVPPRVQNHDVDQNRLILPKPKMTRSARPCGYTYLCLRGSYAKSLTVPCDLVSESLRMPSADATKTELSRNNKAEQSRRRISWKRGIFR